MHTKSSYCQGHGPSPHLSLVFVAVPFLLSNLPYLFTGIVDQLCGSYNYWRLLF